MPSVKNSPRHLVEEEMSQNLVKRDHSSSSSSSSSSISSRSYHSSVHFSSSRLLAPSTAAAAVVVVVAGQCCGNVSRLNKYGIRERTDACGGEQKKKHSDAANGSNDGGRSDRRPSKTRRGAGRRDTTIPLV